MLQARPESWVSLQHCIPEAAFSRTTGLTRALAAEVGKSNIRVNVIVPGYIETDMTAGTSSSAFIISSTVGRSAGGIFAPSPPIVSNVQV
jgi:NAD(P)-dependent dehydrogenase (short-subunit alcohol dehydrogenase family)